MGIFTKEYWEQVLLGIQTLGVGGMLVIILGTLLAAYWFVNMLKGQQIENLRSKNEAAEERVKMHTDRVVDLNDKLGKQDSLLTDLRTEVSTLQRQIEEHASTAQLSKTAETITALTSDVSTNDAAVKALYDAWAKDSNPSVVGSLKTLNEAFSKLAQHSKPKPNFVCTTCQSIFSRWMGKCPTCGEWNTITEIES